MIRLVLGNIGSGKTAMAVRFMKSHPEKKFITNIDVKGRGTDHIMKLKSYMIVKKHLTKTMKNGSDVYKYEFNQDFWKELIQKENNINIIIDEAHQFFNPRRSMSKLNVVTTDMLSMLRRVLGSNEGQGELWLITQLSRRLDIIAKELATDVVWVRLHYYKNCPRCKSRWIESNDSPNRKDECPMCNEWKLTRSNLTVEVMHFRNIEHFSLFSDYHQKTHYKKYLINDISKVFNNYNTLQFEDLFSDL